MLSRIILTLTAAAIAGCGGGGSSSANSTASVTARPSGTTVAPSLTVSPPQRPYSQTDLEIAELIYSGTDRTPGGFYVEPMPAGASYVTTAHVKNTDVTVAGGAAGNPTAFELCTDDWHQALEWSETAAARMPSYGDLVETNSEARFFEFVRVPRTAPSALARQRIFRCSYLDRAGADAQTLDGAGGRLNRRPLTAADMQQLSEYLWHFTAFNNFGSAVLASAAQTPTGTVTHSLTIATLQRAASSTDCDRIEVVRWSHAADPATGAITRSTTLLANLRAQENNGTVTLCEAP